MQNFLLMDNLPNNDISNIELNNDSKDENADKPKVLSKKQIKKMQKTQQWEEKKKLKKQQKKELKQKNKQSNKLEKEQAKQEAKELQISSGVQRKKIKKTEKIQHKLATQNAQPIIIDCSFQNLMTEKEIKSLCMQLAYCHSVNRKFPVPSQIIFTSYKDQIKQKLIKTNVENWGVVLKENHYLDYYDKNKLVYLTGDAEEDLQEVEKECFFFNKSKKLVIYP